MSLQNKVDFKFTQFSKSYNTIQHEMKQSSRAYNTKSSTQMHYSKYALLQIHPNLNSFPSLPLDAIWRYDLHLLDLIWYIPRSHVGHNIKCSGIRQMPHFRPVVFWAQLMDIKAPAINIPSEIDISCQSMQTRELFIVPHLASTSFSNQGRPKHLSCSVSDLVLKLVTIKFPHR